jgi:hypothetical protein
MKSIGPKRVIIFVSTLVPLVLLILALRAPGVWLSPPANIQGVGKQLAGPCSVASPECKTGVKPLHQDPLIIHDIVTTAVSIADRL